MAELDTMEAVLYMQRGHWDDAIRVFSRVIEERAALSRMRRRCSRSVCP